MSITRLVDLYTSTIHIEDASVFLRQTDKDLWTGIRKELRE